MRDTTIDRLLFWDNPTFPRGDPVDPHPEWKQHREMEPVLSVEVPGFDKPIVYLYRYRDVEQAQKDTTNLSSSLLAGSMAIGDRVLIAMDPPEHRDYRAIVAPTLAQRLVAGWDDVLIRRVMNEIIDTIQERGRADFVSEIAMSYPTLVVARIIGLPAEDCERFKLWATDLLAAPVDREPALRAADEVRGYLHDFLNGARPAPDGSILSELLKANGSQKVLTLDEMQSFVMLLIQAGIDTTYRGLSNIMKLLLDRPAELSRLYADRSMIPAAVEEGLRFEPPNTAVARLAIRDLEIGGHRIEAGSIVVPIIASANRDPEFCERPDEFDLDRSVRRHITFGTGIHICLGIHLARMELNTGLDVILSRLPNLRHDAAEAARVGAHLRGLQFRSPTALPILWDR